MWQTNPQAEANSRLIKLVITDSRAPLRFSDVLALFRDSADFRRYFIAQLFSIPFSAFRWETPPVTTASIDRDFECVVLDSPGLSRTPDVAAFSAYFHSHGVDDVAVFPNLGNDAMMIVPCPIADYSAYGHLAAFLRNAPEPQQHSLWKAVGNAMINRLSANPVWLSTAGAGVSWLHVRLDSRPKYYGYSPYKIPPQHSTRAN